MKGQSKSSNDAPCSSGCTPHMTYEDAKKASFMRKRVPSRSRYVYKCDECSCWHVGNNRAFNKSKRSSNKVKRKARKRKPLHHYDLDPHYGEDV